MVGILWIRKILEFQTKNSIDGSNAIENILEEHDEFYVSVMTLQLFIRHLRSSNSKVCLGHSTRQFKHSITSGLSSSLKCQQIQNPKDNSTFMSEKRLFYTNQFRSSVLFTHPVQNHFYPEPAEPSRFLNTTPNPQTLLKARSLSFRWKQKP